MHDPSNHDPLIHDPGSVDSLLPTAHGLFCYGTYRPHTSMPMPTAVVANTTLTVASSHPIDLMT